MKIVPAIVGCIVSAGTLTWAQAQNVSVFCQGLANQVASTYLSDTGDGKGLELIAQNGHCGPPNSEARWRDLTSAYNRFEDALKSGDRKAITAAAENLWHWTHEVSSMETSCWNTMLQNAKFISGSVDAVVTAYSRGACAFQGIK